MKHNLLFEEVMAYNKWVSGMASRELGTQRVTLKDLLTKHIDQSPNNSKAEKPLPYPIPNVIEQLGDMYIKACNSKSLFTQALNNPVIQKNKEAEEQVKKIILKLDGIITMLKQIFYNTDKRVDKKDPAVDIK